MAWSCFHYCSLCDVEHHFYIDEVAEPDCKTTFEYECDQFHVRHRYRYSMYSSEPAERIPINATVARRVVLPSLIVPEASTGPQAAYA